MAVNKVVFGNTTLIDISDSTVTAAHLESGYKAYTKAGKKITGTLVKGYQVVTGSFVGSASTTDFQVTGLSFTPVGAVLLQQTQANWSSQTSSVITRASFSEFDTSSGMAVYGISRTGASTIAVLQTGISLDDDGVHLHSTRPFTGEYVYVIWG